MFKQGKYLLVVLGSVFLLLSSAPVPVMADEISARYSGYFSRDREDGKASEIAGLSQYIKFYQDGWVTMLYIPYDYALTLPAAAIHEAIADIRSRNTRDAYFKDKFAGLEQTAIAHVEQYTVRDDGDLEFECDGTAPCRARIEANTMKIRKAGMISDHLIHYNRITEH